MEPTVLGQRSERETGKPERQAVKPRTAEHAFPQAISQRLPAILLGIVLQFTQADEHVRNVDLYRTRCLAGAAQRGSVRQMRVFTHTVIERGQDATDRAGVDASVGMAADTPIDRAGVQARSAADALQALAK